MRMNGDAEKVASKVPELTRESISNCNSFFSSCCW